LPGSTLKEANQLAKRWRHQFVSCELPAPISKSDVHVSQRVVQLKPDETAATLLARAKSTATAEESQKQRT
jgi:hypothetical protein